MPFSKGSPATQEAARKGGTTGQKHFATVSKTKLKKISAKGGSISRRNVSEKKFQHALKKVDKSTERKVDKIMRTYIR